MQAVFIGLMMKENIQMLFFKYFSNMLNEFMIQHDTEYMFRNTTEWQHEITNAYIYERIKIIVLR